MVSTGERHSGRSTTWPARISGGLLLVQGFAILGVNWYLLSRVDFETDLAAGTPSLQTLDHLALGFFFGLPAILATLSAVGLLLRRRVAWLFAMMAEGLLLASCLYYHFYMTDSQFSRSPYTYAIMASSILMVLYLNTADVRLAYAPDGQMVDVNDRETAEHGV